MINSCAVVKNNLFQTFNVQVPTDVLLAKFDGGFALCELAFVLLTVFLTVFELYQV